MLPKPAAAGSISAASKKNSEKIPEKIPEKEVVSLLEALEGKGGTRKGNERKMKGQDKARKLNERRGKDKKMKGQDKEMK